MHTPTHHRRCSMGRCAQPWRSYHNSPLFDVGETMAGRCFIQINNARATQYSQQCWRFFAYKKILGRTETRTSDRMYCQSIRTVWDISRDDRARIATCSLLTPTDRLKENYSIDYTLPPFHYMYFSPAVLWPLSTTFPTTVRKLTASLQIKISATRFLSNRNLKYIQ